MSILDIGVYLALLSLTVAGISSMFTTLVLLRELSSLDRQVIRMDKLIGALEFRFNQPERAGQ